MRRVPAAPRDVPALRGRVFAAAAEPAEFRASVNAREHGGRFGSEPRLELLGEASEIVLDPIRVYAPLEVGLDKVAAHLRAHGAPA
jgi:hypothetical protein